MDDFDNFVFGETMETLLLYAQDYRVLTIRRDLAEVRFLELTPADVVLKAFILSAGCFDEFDNLLQKIDTDWKEFEKFADNFQSCLGGEK